VRSSASPEGLLKHASVLYPSLRPWGTREGEEGRVRRREERGREEGAIREPEWKRGKAIRFQKETDR
jgi:hypothetical protein